MLVPPYHILITPVFYDTEDNSPTCIWESLEGYSPSDFFTIGPCRSMMFEYQMVDKYINC